jgi:heme-degrading monooxygenase HmoA
VAQFFAKTDAAMAYIVNTPKPPYYAVVFTSINADVDHTEHTKMYRRMVEIAASYEGYIGIEPARNPDGSGVAVIYWKDLASIQAFARDPEHRIAKKKGREIWYSHYLIRICKVERDYGRPEESESTSSSAQAGGVDA